LKASLATKRTHLSLEISDGDAARAAHREDSLACSRRKQHCILYIAGNGRLNGFAG
jgi:hypothetical protein